MEQYITGKTIRTLRENHGMTQAELAEKIGVSDKTISKWETSKGYPDVSLIEPIANAFGITIVELFSGHVIENVNIAANVMRAKTYVCPVCGNIINSMGEAVIHCHGVQLQPCEPEETDGHHEIIIEKVEDDYYVRVNHEMKKEHYISFITAVSGDSMQMVKLYPEGNAEARFPIRGVRKILFYCNRDGLFAVKVK